MKILYVDDNEGVRKLARMHFRNSEFDLDIVENGSIAKDKLNDNNYDLVITDVLMPVIDGEKLKLWIDDNYPGMKVLFTSAYWMRAEELGQEYIKKPLTPDSLRKALV